MAVTLLPGARVHIVGIGGAGMSGLARLLAESGLIVSGSDATSSALLDELSRQGIEVHEGHAASNVGASEVVMWSPAVAPDNVELVEAKRRGALLLTRSEVLRELALRQRVVGLTGTHGKTTATSMMVHVCQAAGRDDSRLLGAAVLGIGANGHYGHDDLILEVDESYGTFGLLRPYALGVLNIEADHLDHYGTLENLETAFAALMERTSGPVVVWLDDDGARRVSTTVARAVLSVGTGVDAQWTVRNVELARQSSSFELVSSSEQLKIGLRVTGHHNVANAAVVAVMAIELGVSTGAVQRGLGNFQGAPRRFQFLKRWGSADVYEDYAHLPGEIIATLRATKSAGYERITAVFQPHRVTRTSNLLSSFATAFDGATEVIVTNIYDAGEANPLSLTGEIVANAIRGVNQSSRTVYAPTFESVREELERVRDTSDVILLLGAGDIATVAQSLDSGSGA